MEPLVRCILRCQSATESEQHQWFIAENVGGITSSNEGTVQVFVMTLNLPDIR